MINGDMKSITYLRYLHRFNGFSILIMSVVQVALGLNIAFPNTETRGSQYWYAYAFVVAFWVVAFICVELFWCGE